MTARYLRMWLVENQMALTRCEHVYNHGERAVPVTYHYLCDRCGEVWARSGPADIGTETVHLAARQPCPRHEYSGLALLHRPFQPELNDSIPMPYLADTLLDAVRFTLKRSVA